MKTVQQPTDRKLFCSSAAVLLSLDGTLGTFSYHTQTHIVIGPFISPPVKLLSLCPCVDVGPLRRVCYCSYFEWPRSSDCRREDRNSGAFS